VPPASADKGADERTMSGLDTNSVFGFS